jgi:uncharacterized protein
MRDTGTYPQDLPRGECLRLMSTVGVGRIVYTRRALPAVELVNFTMDGEDIVISTVNDELAYAVRDSVVAFETDHFSPHDHIGWTVTVIGRSCEVADLQLVDRRRHVVRIAPEIITGRALHLIPSEAHNHPVRAAS